VPRFNRKQRELNRLIREVKSRRFPYEPREEREIDWSKYDQAQLNEINDMLLAIRDAVEAAALRLGAENRRNSRGRPPHPAADLAKAVLMQQYFGVSNRVATGLVLLFKEKMRIGHVFSYKTIERAYENPEVAAILDEVLKLSQESVRDLEHSFAADGSGLPTSIKQNWDRDREDEELCRKYEKLIAMVGTTYGVISAVELPDNPAAHEAPFLPGLLSSTTGAYSRVDLVSLDEAYLSRRNCELIASFGATPRISPKQGITLKRMGSWAWAEMLLSFIEDPQAWLREYHLRSVSESMFSAFKRSFAKPLMKRIRKRRKLEAFVRVCAYNLKRLCYLRYLKGLDVGWKAS
jgi:transposase